MRRKRETGLKETRDAEEDGAKEGAKGEEWKRKCGGGVTMEFGEREKWRWEGRKRVGGADEN